MRKSFRNGMIVVAGKFYEDDGFDLTCTEANVKGDVGGTSVRSARSIREEWIFDYILVKGDLDPVYYTVVDNPIDTDGKYPSDHVPVLAKVYLR